MPIYEYRCTKGHTFEVMQRMTDDPVHVCEVCGKPVQRVFHPVAVHFKGKGFYNTDYGTKRRNRELAAAGEGKGSDSSSSSDTKSETTKSDTKSTDSTSKDSGTTSKPPSESKAKSKPDAKSKKAA